MTLSSLSATIIMPDISSPGFPIPSQQRGPASTMLASESNEYQIDEKGSSQSEGTEDETEPFQPTNARSRRQSSRWWRRTLLWLPSGEWWEQHLSLKPRQIPKRIAICSAIAIAILFWLLYFYSSRLPMIHHPRPRIIVHSEGPVPDVADVTSFQKPEGIKIIGIVFYGRRATVEILECYLRKNLASQGGMLDAIHFIINTEDKDDLEWIEGIVASVTDYKSIDMPKGTDPRDYEKVWRTAVQPGHMYVKFDDDLVCSISREHHNAASSIHVITPCKHNNARC